MKAGPKGVIVAPPLDLRRLPKRGGARCIAFIERYVTVPKGTGAKRRMRLRPWQRAIVRGVLDEPRPRQALVSIPAGNGKSTLAAAIGLYGLLADGVEGAQVLVVASDERQARIIFNTARRMVELDADLAARVQVYADHLHEPRTDSTFMALPADPGSLQGWDPSMALVDELHVVTDDTFEAISARAGKRDRSRCCWPSRPRRRPARTTRSCGGWSTTAASSADPSFYFAEFAAPAGCALDDEAAVGGREPGAGRLPAPRRAAGHAAAENARGRVPPLPAGPVDGRRRRLAARRRVGRAAPTPPACVADQADVVLGVRRVVLARLQRAGGRHRRAPAARPAGRAMGSARRRPRLARARGRRRGRHPGGVPALARARGRRRPLPLAALAGSARRRRRAGA